MTDQAYIALSTLIFLVFVEAAAVAFLFGGLFSRVKALEARKDGSDCAAALASMEATLKGLKEMFEQRISALEQAVARRGAQ